MSLRIGEIIKEQIEAKGWSLATFAKEANMSYRNVMYLVKKEDMSVEQLVHISKVLQYDFMKRFISATGEAENVSTNEQTSPLHSIVPKDFTTMMFSLTIAGDSHAFQKFPDFIKQVKKYADTLGFIVL